MSFGPFASNGSYVAYLIAHENPYSVAPGINYLHAELVDGRAGRLLGCATLPMGDPVSVAVSQSRAIAFAPWSPKMKAAAARELSAIGAT